MPADLNYALKRLVRGLTAESHALKRGFFLATSKVLCRFQRQIDAVKFLRFVREECKTSKGMTGPEIHSLAIGKLMCISAIVDSKTF